MWTNQCLHLTIFKSLEYSDYLSSVCDIISFSVTAPNPKWFFNAPPEGIILPFKLLLFALNLHSLFFTCDNWAENVTFTYSEINDLLGLERQWRLKEEIMTIIDEQFTQGEMLAKEARRLTCPKCQCAFQNLTEDTRCLIKPESGQRST